MNYKVRYAILDPHLIFNYNAPTERAIEKHNARNGFYTQLEASILKDGIRNPIIVVSGFHQKGNDLDKFPEHMRGSNALYCRDSGCSRLWVAQKNNIDIPCLIADANNRFSDQILLNTEEEVLKYYTDEISYIRFASNRIIVAKKILV